MRRASLFVLVLAGCGGDDAVTPVNDAAPDAPPDVPVPPFDPLEGVGTVEKVPGTFMFTEGPQWRDTQGDLLFTDIPASTIYRLKDGTITPLTTMSGMANGLALDVDGTLLSARHGSRNIVRGDTELVGEYEGDRFNSPNDLVMASNGELFFTDPPYGLANPSDAELDFNGVFRRLPDGTLDVIYAGNASARPNGIGISPDNTRVYFADTATSKLWVYLRAGDPPGVVELTGTAAGPDGLAIDTGGNIFVTTSMGVEAYGPDGHRWGVITLPEQPANCAFGDVDGKTLYITARTGLYKVRLAHAGLPTH